MKFKEGDKVYLHKRGIMINEYADWTVSRDMLRKNKIYTVEHSFIYGVYTTKPSVRVYLEGYIYAYSQEHFKKYEV